jgi:hypothetical protein
MLVERRFDVGATVVAEGEPGRSMFIDHGELVVTKRMRPPQPSIGEYHHPCIWTAPQGGALRRYLGNRSADIH